MINDIALTMQQEVGPKTAIHLLECFGSAEQLYAASVEEIILRAKLKPAIAKNICQRTHHAAAEQELRFIEKNKIKAIRSSDPEYPQRLLESPDYPHVIYVKGEIDLNAARFISVVGTRRITPYGNKITEKILGEVAEMFPDAVIVSGLALGIDVAAHRVALQYNLRTIGVLGHPLTHIYPPQHTETARRMVQSGGALISEFHSGVKPDRSGFVQRNRIIAGLSEATLVVESASKGGSLITADMADGYNRMVMAVPGRLGDPSSEGTNFLIKSLKAQMVTSGRDLANLLGWEPAIPATQALLFGSTDSEAPPQGTPNEVRLLSFLRSDIPTSMDELSLVSGFSLPQLSGILLGLEFSGKVAALPGKMYLRC